MIRTDSTCTCLKTIQTDTSSILLTYIKLRTTGLFKNTLYLQDIQTSLWKIKNITVHETFKSFFTNS